MVSQKALLLMSHGNFAKEALKSAELIVGVQENYATLGVHVDSQVDQLKDDMFEKVQNLDTNQGLIILTDIIGGTPTNLSSNLLDKEDVLVCSGLNLPILLEVLLNRDKSIPELRKLIQGAYDNGLTMRTMEDIYREDEDEDDIIL